MSDIPADWRDRLNVREQIARIDRSIDEAAKLRAEQGKLFAEGQKFSRERWLAPLTAGAALLAAGAALASSIIALLLRMH